MSGEFEFEPAISAGKRCGLRWVPWMGDWFNSWSPRNGNENAEGPWDHWVSLAIEILQHPATEIVRPEAFEAVKGLKGADFSMYSETTRDLTDEEVKKLFEEES